MTELYEYRKQIDDIDLEILDLFRERLELMPHIAKYKRVNSLPIEDTEREQSIINKRSEGCAEYAELLRTMMKISKDVQRSFFNLYIIGMPYSGKSTLLNTLSQHTDRKCVDMDRLIENQSGMSISEIFENDGEAAFRKAETELLRLLAGDGSLIIATGGGIVKSDENIKLMQTGGYVVLCDTPLDKLCEAYEKDKDNSRPLIKSVEDIEVLYFERFKRYREIADIIINPYMPNALSDVLQFIKEKGLR